MAEGWNAERPEIVEGFGDVEAEASQSSGVWIHVPRQGHVDLCILSVAPMRYRSHWVRGKMHPCSLPERCRWHDLGMGSQVRYALSVLLIEGRVPVLWEIGPMPASILARAVSQTGALRGQCWRVRKEGGKQRGKLLLEWLNAMLNPKELPAAVDPAVHLMRQWGLMFEVDLGGGVSEFLRPGDDPPEGLSPRSSFSHQPPFGRSPGGAASLPEVSEY